MTSKTRSKKRQAILDAAVQVFREMGFHNASMNIIAARVGGSKTTLYNHFPSKEAIFLEIVRDITQVQNPDVAPMIDLRITILTDATRNRIETALSALQGPVVNVPETLRCFGENFISFIYMPEVLAIRRLLFAESRQSEIGRLYYENGPKRARQRVADYLEKAMAAGYLKKTDAWVAAAHIRSLLDAECYEYYMLDVGESLPASRIKKMVASAVDVFMAAYGAT
ncbi:TetR/AcrR family transcriptional regulator [Oxalobacter vibrioformis]|uniref:TetR/AcrR family transcriptional regulator n=1 Tax=Oxalobacter vibrioformis TaxID=933080 RepID=A0A9E9LVU0_9BURK|nr:TetR/AcrR family transcriptional regulator [Oxalobacter vibrioformis]WAW10131.1 TetR/AcrR family transcriptional regulator [Oxalobacter vibrioformis]